ncbi:ankyrin [Pyrenochaeta sp. DS3sAY3a]|nr:ankyrin [Pyrenochaeta sp. DS3sAY3a]
MPNSVVSSSGKGAPNLWKEAYNALNAEEKGEQRLRKLHAIIKEQLGKPKLKLRSGDGYKQLFALIQKKSKRLEASKSSEKVGKVCDNMLRIQDLVAAGVNVGGPYVAIPAAALFLAFSMNQIYRSEKEAMFKLAESVAHYTVLNAKSHDRIKIAASDDEDMKDLKRNLHMVYIGLYKSLLLASTQLTIALYGGGSQFIGNLMKRYEWGKQLQDLEKEHAMCKEYRDEMLARQKSKDQRPAQTPISSTQRHKNMMGPAPRNPLHWAVALTVPEQVTHLVQKNEYPINALTPRSWTAAHLAARQGNTKIMKTLLTAPGINLKLVTEQGHTALHIAALHNRVGAVKILLQRDERLLPIRDKLGRTAFLLAARRGHLEVLKAMKEVRQDLNEVTAKNGWSGLHLAAEQGHVHVVKYLVANGAKKDMKVRDGRRKGLNARQIAEKEGKMNVLAVL